LKRNIFFISFGYSCSSYHWHYSSDLINVHVMIDSITTSQ